MEVIMKARSFLPLLVVALVFTAAGVLVSRAFAQTTTPLPPRPDPQMHITVSPNGLSVLSMTAEPAVLSGPDVGIRVSGIRDGQVFGTLVVRVQGKWTSVQTI